jgi:hypothetical protein
LKIEMKKILLIAVLAVASIAAYAQPRAIGVRMGAFDGISYEHGFGDNMMLEVEAGWALRGYTDFWRGNDNVKVHGRSWGQTAQLAATFDWIDPFGATFSWSNRGEWHWYMGVGVAGGYGWRASAHAGELGVLDADANWGFVGPCGRFGIEYTFWFPLQLSLDYRPVLGAGLYDDQNKGVEPGLYWDLFGLCLSARYRF